jgi:hypothetical protein
VLRIILILSLVQVAFIPLSYSQNHLFERDHILYVSAGYLKGKRIVSGIEVKAKDSTNRQIQVKLEVMENWITTDTATFELFVDTSKHEFIYVDDRKYEAIHYRTADNKVQINFEKPREFTYYVQGGTEKMTSWLSTFAAVRCSNRFKKYNRVLQVYYEK